MGEALTLQDRRGVIVECNPAACALFGYEPDGLQGLRFSAIPLVFLCEDGTPLPPEEHPVELAMRLGRPMRNVLLGMRPAVRPAGAPHPEGSTPPTRWILVNAMPLGQGQANPGVVSTFTDMTAYHQGQGVRLNTNQAEKPGSESDPRPSA
jgi:PAS domain-containing protein